MTSMLKNLRGSLWATLNPKRIAARQLAQRALGVLVSGVLAVPEPVIAQTGWFCEVPDVIGEGETYPKAPLPGPGLRVRLTVRIYVWRATCQFEPQNEWSTAEIDAGLAVLRDDYASAKIDFIEVGRGMFDACSPDDDAFNGLDDTPLHALSSSTRLDLFFLTKNSAVVGCDQLFQATGHTPGIPATWAEVRGADANTVHLLSHEVGHALGLHHTHAGLSLNGAPAEDPLQWPEQHCELAGDLVCDTPPSVDMRELCALDANCEFNPTQQQIDDWDGTYPLDTYDPPTDNIMSYSDIHCPERFTAGQFERIFYVAETHPTVMAMIEPDGYPEFAEKSVESSFNWAGRASSAVAADLDGDGDQDLLVSDQRDGQHAGWMENGFNATYESVPLLTDRMSLKFELDERPVALRGLSVADLDNDGDLDIFGASKLEPRLYMNEGAGASYAGVPDANFPAPLASMAGDSWSAAIADFDRDGLLDIYVGRAGTSGSGSAAVPGAALGDLLLRNEGALNFSDASSIIWLNGADQLATSSASWADVNLDGEVDLFVGSYGQDGSQLFRNTVDASGLRVLDNSPTLLPTSPNVLQFVRTVNFADLNNDGNLDLVLGHAETAEPGARLLWNDGSGTFPTTSNVATTASVSASLVLDQNLDGALDLILAADVPAPNPSSPVALRNSAASPGNSFEDVTYDAGLAGSVVHRVTALASADFGGDGGTPDGDLDLYLGRSEAAGKLFFRAQTSLGGDDPQGTWLRVRTKAAAVSGLKLPGNNRNLIGAQVTVQQPSTGTPVWQQTQLVDAGSGFGSQGVFPLSFGIPDPNASAKITLRAPDGSTRTKTISANSYITETTIIDSHSPGLDDASVTFNYVVSQGPGPWTFKWFHQFSAGYYEVEIYEAQGCDVMPGSTIVLQQGVTPGVIVTRKAVAGGYDVTFKWNLVPCIASCAHTYRVTCFNGNNSSQSSLKTAHVPVCGQIW